MFLPDQFSSACITAAAPYPTISSSRAIPGGPPQADQIFGERLDRKPRLLPLTPFLMAADPPIAEVLLVTGPPSNMSSSTALASSESLNHGDIWSGSRAIRQPPVQFLPHQVGQPRNFSRSRFHASFLWLLWNQVRHIRAALLPFLFFNF